MASSAVDLRQHAQQHAPAQSTYTLPKLSPVVLVVTCSGVVCTCSEEPRFSSDVKYYYPGRRQSRGYGFHRRLSVCLSLCLSVCFFSTISQKPMHLGSSNLTQKCSTMSPGNPFILGSKDPRSRSRGTKNQCRCVIWDSCECCLLLVTSVTGWRG